MVKVKEQDLLDKGLTQADIQEFKDTWSFSDTATAKIKETIQPTTTPSVTPIMETPAPVQPTQTPVPTTETPKQVEEVKTEVTQPVKLPEFQQQINEQLDSWKTIEEVRDTIKTSWKLDQAQFNEVDKYLVQKADEKLKKQEQIKSMDNVDSLFTAVKSWTIIPEDLKTSNNYIEAKKRFDTYNMYSSMTDAQLSASIWNGNILPGTKVYEDLIKDPIQKARIEKIQKYNIITWKTPKTEDVFTNKSNEIINNTDVIIWDSKITLKQALDDGYISENELNSMTNNSQIITKAKEVEELKNEYDTKLRDYKNLAKTIEKELKGTWATQTDIATAVAMAQEKLLPWLQELESRTNNALWTLTQMKADSAQLFATNLSLYNQQLVRQQQLQDTQSARDFEKQQTADQRKFQKEMTQEERAYNQAQADKELQQKYDFTYWDINSQDPRVRNIAITNWVDELMDTYAKQWFVFQKSKADMIDEVNQAVSQGQTLWQALTTISQRVQSSNRYKELTKPKVTESWAKLSDWSLYNQTTWEIKSIENIGDTWWLWDLRSMASQFPWQAWAKNNNPAWITWNANFDAWKWTAALLKEAWINYTKGTSRPASEWGSYVSFDTIEDGLKAQRIIMTQTYGNSTVEQMLGKWVWTWEALNYAKQVAWNAWIDLKTKVSDLSEQEVSQLQLSKIKKESPWLFKILTETQADIWPIDSWSWAPISYARRIKGMVPATLMNSEVELKQLNETIWELYKQWVSAEDAVLTYLWVDFKPEVKNLWIALIDKVRGLELDPSYYSSMTDLLNKWDINQAVRKTENLAVKEAQKLNPDLKFSEWWTTFSVKQANNLLDLVNKYESKFGTITWKWENLTKWFFGDEEAQKLATQITQAISKMRNDLVGANITWWEQWAIEALIPRLDESAETAKVKIKNLKTAPLMQYNQARVSVWLPELDEKSLLDINTRINLYKWTPTQTKTKTPTQTQTTWTMSTAQPQKINELREKYFKW